MNRVRSLVRCLWVLASVSASTAALAIDAGDGLTVPGSMLNWDRWQSRVAVNSDLPLWRANLNAGSSAGLQVSGLSVMSDYYFAGLPLGAKGAGGFRATSGVLLGAGGSVLSGGSGSTWGLNGRNGLLPSTDTNTNDLNRTVPYVGVGYSGLTSRDGWGFAADVGLMGRSADSGVRLGRGYNNAQNLDDMLRDMRIAPVVQLGVSYSF